MLNILIILFTAIILREISALMGIVKSIKYFSHSSTKQINKLDKIVYPHIVIVICVLREQKIIENTISYFSSMSYPKKDIIFVTTEREEKTNVSNGITTKEALERFQTIYEFQLLHYPNSNGTKADQMNLAIIKWKDILSAKDTENTFLVFYDADSRPHKNTFYYFAAIYSQNPKCNIFQQSSFFDIPIRLSGLSSKSNLQNIFCRASSLRANRFVLAYEIPRILNRLSLYKKRKSYGSILGFFTFAHCVGHGLFIRSSFAQQVLFPENSILEDMFYGFIVNYLREPVIPIPIMNNSEVPNDFENLFFQMSRWFLGPSRFIKYYNYAKNRYKEYSRYYLGNFSLVMSCLIITLAWLLTSPFFLVLFSTLIFLPVLSLNGIINHGNYIIQSLIIISLLLYFFSILLMILYHPRLCHLAGTSKIGNRINVMQAIQLLMIYPAILIFHSFPAYHSIINLFFAKGKSFTKKTERQ